jgi:Uroporphyrinogen decarboxylase (URO-D)
MNTRDRFRAVMSYEPCDRPILWHFGLWGEAKTLWAEQGLPEDVCMEERLGMDPSFLEGKVGMGPAMDLGPLCPGEPQILEETDDYKIVRHPTGSLNKVTKATRDAMSHAIEYAMQPTRESWERFKPFLRSDLSARLSAGWQARVDELAARPSVVGLGLPGLFRMPEFWLGVEGVTYMIYDEPDVFADMMETMTQMYMETMTPVLQRGRFDYVYVFEDCCGSTGPLISPDMYDRFLAPSYRCLFDLAHDHGAFVLMDSDGKVDDLIPHWIETGMDILFPVEVGKWGTDPVALRRRFGKDLRMIGGFNKHTIRRGEEAIRSELQHLKPLVDEGGFIPMPDHKIPPDCSFDQFRTYVRVFKEVFFPSWR